MDMRAPWRLVAPIFLFVAACSGDSENNGGLWSDLLSQRGEGGRITQSQSGAVTSTVIRNGRPVIVYGSENLVGGSGYSRAQGVLQVDDGILLNFQAAPLREVVDTVLGTILEENYTIDPRVSGQVTIQTVSPLSQQDAIAALETVLRQNSAAMTEIGGVINVVPIEEAGAGARTPALAGGEVSLRPGFGVLVAPLRSASAPDLAALLQPLAGPQTFVQFDNQRNVLILSGNSQELNSLRETIQLFDVDWLDGLSYGLFPLKNAPAASVVEELITVLGGEASPVAQQTQIQPVERLNAVLVVAKRRKTLDELAEWVQRLDRKANLNGQQIYVYDVENARASDIAKVLGDVIGGSASGGQSGAVPGADTVTLASGDVAPAAATVALDNGDQISIAANDSNNSLVINATPEGYRRLQPIIRRLDAVPLQVVLEATIAEVTLNNELSYGVQFFLESGNFSLASSNSSTGAVSASFPGMAASFLRGDTSAILSALDTVTSLNVISSPRLMVLDNQSARLQVGDEVPIITQQQQSTADDANIINNIEFKETGVILEITPRVNSSGLVTLQILQETSNVVDGSVDGTLTPTISQRIIESSIAVQDGSTILLGGMIQERNSAGKTGVPVLSDLPAVGGLFGTRSNGLARTELIVLLTPRVVRNPNEVRVASEEMRMRLQNMRPQFFPKNELTRTIARRNN